MAAECDEWRCGRVTLDAPVGRVEVEVFEASTSRFLVRGRSRGAPAGMEFYGARADSDLRTGVPIQKGVVLGIANLVEGHWWIAAYADGTGGFVVTGVREVPDGG